MKNEYNIFLRIARWIRRFRHRCGYGVHSPFAFDFITSVVYCSDAYYAYEPLRRTLEPSISRLDEYDPLSGLTAKDLRLLFRITNWAEPTTIQLYGASPAVEAHIRAARGSLIPDALQKRKDCSKNEDSILAYCDTPREASGRKAETIIVRGIHTTPEARDRWEQLKTSPLCTISFDLGRFGIIVHRPKINRQHYVVNYF